MPDLTQQIDALFDKWDAPQTPGCVLQISVAFVRFERGDDGKVKSCRISTNRARNILFERT